MSVFIEKQYFILQTNEKQDLKCNSANYKKRIYSTDFKLSGTKGKILGIIDVR
jgi:hypothetical protein